MKVSFSKVITKKWKSHLEVWVAKRHLHRWLIAKHIYIYIYIYIYLSIPTVDPNIRISNIEWVQQWRHIRTCNFDDYEFGSFIIKNYFKWIDNVKLIVIKCELNIKWFMFEYIHVKKRIELQIWMQNSCVESKLFNF